MNWSSQPPDVGLRPGSRGRTVVAVGAFVVLLLLSGFSMLLSAPGASLNHDCLSTDEALICEPFGPPLIILSFAGCGFLGAAAGLVGMQAPRLRAVGLISGYAITVNGLLFGLYMSQTSPYHPM
jgi:hypothetical protein